MIRDRLRALLADAARPGWVPDDPRTDDGDEDEPSTERAARPADLPGLARHRAPGPSVRLDPGRPGARALWIAALTGVALVLLWTWLQRPSSQPVPTGSAEPAVRSELSAPAADAVPSPSVGEAGRTSATVVVSVVGQVAEPGLVTLAPGSRVADAIEAVGGLLPDADPGAVNLAAVVTDGQQVAVGVPAAPGAEPESAPVAGGGPVNLNTADVSQLDALPGIGPVLAQRIVDHRDQQGPFRDVQDLQDVAGIGPTILERLAGAVTV